MEEDDAGCHRELCLSDLASALIHLFHPHLATDGWFDVPGQFKR